MKKLARDYVLVLLFVLFGFSNNSWALTSCCWVPYGSTGIEVWCDSPPPAIIISQDGSSIVTSEGMLLGLPVITNVNGSRFIPVLTDGSLGQYYSWRLYDFGDSLGSASKGINNPSWSINFTQRLYDAGGNLISDNSSVTRLGSSLYDTWGKYGDVRALFNSLDLSDMTDSIGFASGGFVGIGLLFLAYRKIGISFGNQ